MSRTQQQQVLKTATDQNKQTFGDAENSLKQTEAGIADYQSQLAKYAAANPYNAGGEFQKAENRVLADTAGGMAQGARAQLDAAARRGGMNPMAPMAAAEGIENQNERNLAGQEAGAEQQRIASEAGYNKDVLAATQFPVEANSRLYDTSLGASSRDLSIADDASKTPGFWDTFGSSFAKGLGGTLGEGVSGVKSLVGK